MPAFWLVSPHNSQFSLILISPSFLGQITTVPNPHHQAGAKHMWCGGLHKQTRNARTKLRFSGENPPLFFTPAAVVCCAVCVQILCTLYIVGVVISGAPTMNFPLGPRVVSCTGTDSPVEWRQFS